MYKFHKGKICRKLHCLIEKWATIPLTAGDLGDGVGSVAKWVRVLQSSAILSWRSGLVVGPLAQKTPTPNTLSFVMIGDSSSFQSVISSFSILNYQACKMPVLVAESPRFRKTKTKHGTLDFM